MTLNSAGWRHRTDREICHGDERSELLVRSFLVAEKHEHRDLERREGFSASTS
jgi:hypothetical protein